jgi:hypothetical protein
MLSATMYPDIGVAIGVAPDGWYLWDVPSGDRVATGQGALLDRKGPVFLVRVGVAEPTLEVRAVSDGHLLGSITPAGPHSFADEHGQGYCELPPCTLVGLATNGGYVWTRDPSGKLNTWLPDGTPSFAFSGDYRSVGFREIFASAARLAVAAGPAGANVVEYLNMTSGAQGSSKTAATS